jgi:O-antigen/teichoic acid export membrane protein
MGDAAVGLYQANYKLAIPMMMFITVFDYAWKPFFLKGTPNREKRKDFQNALIYFTSVAAFLFLTISFYIEPLVTLKIGGFSLLPESYWSGLHIIPIVLAGYIANGFVTHLTIGIYFRKKTAYLPLITGVAALTNIGCLYLFVPTMGITGAAWATLVAYVVAAGGGYFFSRRLYPLRYNYVAIGKILLVTILLYSVSLSIPDLPWWGITLQTGLMLLFLPALAFSGVEEIAHGGRILRSYWAKI